MTSLFGNQSETITDLLNKPKFINLARYFYWGLYSNEEDFNRNAFAKKIFNNNYEINNNLSFFYKIIKKLINDEYINIFDYKTYYENEKKSLYAKGIFTETGKFPNCISSNNIEKCKCLKDYKINQNSCKQENKDKIIPSLSLLIKIYNEEKIKEQLLKYDKNPNKDDDLVISHDDFLPSKDSHYNGDVSSQGGYKLSKFTGGKPIQLSKEICNDEDLLNDISIFIKNYINEDEIEKFRCLKKLIDRKKKIDTIIKLYELIKNTENTENEEKINKFKDLLVKVIQQIDTFFNGINQLFIKNSTSKELNKLGKYIYKSINGENYDDNSEDKAKDDGATNPNLQSMQNHTNTCYINSLLQAIRGCKPLLNKFLEIKDRCQIKDNNLINSFYNILDLITSEASSPLNMLPFCEAVWSSSSSKGQFRRHGMADSTELLEEIVSNLDKINCISNEFDFYNIKKLNVAMPNYFLQIVTHTDTNLQDALKLPKQNILKDDAPFIILRTKLDDHSPVMNTVKTKLPKDGIIRIYNQTFKLCSVILNKPGLHYFTITNDGFFSDEDRIPGSQPMNDFIENSEYTYKEWKNFYGNLYFFERVGTQESYEEAPDEEPKLSIELMNKYYDWNNNNDLQDKEFLGILDSIIQVILQNPDIKFAVKQFWHASTKYRWIIDYLLEINDPEDSSEFVTAELKLKKPYKKETLTKFFIDAKMNDPKILRLKLSDSEVIGFQDYEALRKEAKADPEFFIIPKALLSPLHKYSKVYNGRVKIKGEYEIEKGEKSLDKQFRILNLIGEQILTTFQGPPSGGGYLKNKPYLSEGKSIKDNYFHKYLKYKNKYLELCKLKKNW